MTLTTSNTIAPQLLNGQLREVGKIMAGATLVLAVTVLLFTAANYIDATSRGAEIAFGRGLWMYTIGFLPWFALAPVVVIVSQRHLFGDVSRLRRALYTAILTMAVFSALLLNMLFVYAPLMGIPTSEIAGRIGVQPWIPDILIFIIAVLVGGALGSTSKQTSKTVTDAPAPIDIVVKSVSRMDVISSDAIMAISAQGNYVSLLTQEREFLHRATLSDMRASLDGYGYIQTHRSHLVKSQEIASVHRKDGRVRELTLRNGAKIPVSPQGARALPSIFANSDKKLTET